MVRQGHEEGALGLYKLVASNAVSPEVRSAAWLSAGRLAPTAAEAEASYRHSQEQHPMGMSAAEAGLELGKLYFAQGNYKTADQVLASVQNRLMGTPSATQVNLFRARTAMALRMYGPAAVVWKDLGRARSTSQRADYGVGQALLADGNPASALAAFDRYTQSYPAGDYLAAALAGSIRAAGKTGEKDRLNERKARLAMVAPGSWEAEELKLVAPPARSAVATAPMHPAVAPVSKPSVAPASKPAVAPLSKPSVAPLSRPAVSPGAKPAAAAAAKARSASVPPPRMPAVKKEQEPAPKPVEPPATHEGAAAGSAYLQLGLFSTRDHAEKLVSDLKGRGLAATVHEVASGPRRLFQVRSEDNFSDAASARAAGERFRAVGFKTQVKPGNE